MICQSRKLEKFNNVLFCFSLFGIFSADFIWKKILTIADLISLSKIIDI